MALASGFRVNTNGSATGTYNSYAKSQAKLEQHIERLSSGLRLNKAADDTAGMAISVRLQNQTRGFKQAQRNSEQAINMLQTAEGGLNEIHGIAARMRELAVQAASDNITDNDRASIDLEFQQLKNEVTRIANTTEYNEMKMIDGSQKATVTEAIATADNFITESKVQAGDYTLTDDGAGSVTLTIGDSTQTLTGVTAGTGTLNFDELGVKFDTVAAYALGGLNNETFTVADGSTIQVGSDGNSDSRTGFSIGNSTASGLSIDTIDVRSVVNAQSAITSLDTAIDRVNDDRSLVGAKQNRLEFAMSNLSNIAQNVDASNSTIADADFAGEAAGLAKSQILVQSGTAMLAQANQISQNVMGLLK